MGKLIAWPGSKLHDPEQPQPEVVYEETQAGDILRQLLPSAHNIDTLLVVGTDKDGITGFLTTLDGINEVIAYIRKLEFQILKGEVDKTKPINNGGDTA